MLCCFCFPCIPHEDMWQLGFINTLPWWMLHSSLRALLTVSVRDVRGPVLCENSIRVVEYWSHQLLLYCLPLPLPPTSFPLHE